MVTIRLARLVAGRDLADALVDAAGNIARQVVVVDASGTTDGSRSFASQLVRRILVDGGAAEMRLVAAPGEFADYVTQSAANHGVATRLELLSHDERVPA